MDPIKSNPYIKTNTLQQNISSVKTESFEKILEDARNSKDNEKLMDACRSFESIFLQMMLKNMRNTITEDGFIEKSYGREIFEGMYDEKLSEEMTKGQGIGLAQQMYKQLSKQIKSENNE